MFNKFLRFGLVSVFLVGVGGGVCVRAILEGILLLLLFLGFIVEVRRGDESDDLFERVFGVFTDEEVYESGYAAEQALKVAYDQGRSKFSGRGTVIGFEWNGYWWRGERKVLVAGADGGMEGCRPTAFLGDGPELRVVNEYQIRSPFRFDSCVY